MTPLPLYAPGHLQTSLTDPAGDVRHLQGGGVEGSMMTPKPPDHDRHHPLFELVAFFGTCALAALVGTVLALLVLWMLP